MSEINTWPGWKNVRVVGEGSYGKVYEIQKQEYGKTYTAALKVITIPKNQAEIQSAYSDGMDKESVTTYFRSVVEGITDEFALMYDLKGYTNIVSYQEHMVVEHENEIGWDILIRMELLTSLKFYSMQNTLTENRVLDLGCDICRALELCWDLKIIHRDIKPENIFVNKHGDFELGDFGVARTVENEMTAGSLAGTDTYMAPEVYLGRKYGHTADIYSVGLVLYRYLNYNRMPFLPMGNLLAKDRERAKERRMKGEAIPAPANGSEKLKQVVLKALEYDPVKRYRSAAEFRKELESCYNYIEINGHLDSDGEINSYTAKDSFDAAQHLIEQGDGEKSHTERVKPNMELSKANLGSNGSTIDVFADNSKDEQADIPADEQIDASVNEQTDISVNDTDLHVDNEKGTERVKPLMRGSSSKSVPNSNKRRQITILACSIGAIAIVAAVIIMGKKPSPSVAINEGVAETDSIADGKIVADSAKVFTGKTMEVAFEAEGHSYHQNEALTWKSSDESVASVSELGIVTGVSAGKATIMGEYRGFEADMDIIVEDESVVLSVPDLTGLSTKKALGKLEKIKKKSGFTFSIGQKKKKYSSKVKKGCIISQSPKAESRERTNKSISILISKGPEMVKMPEVKNLTQEVAEKKLKKTGLMPNITAEYNLQTPKGRVISQGSKAGAKVEKGSRVEILVSSGPVPVQDTGGGSSNPTNTTTTDSNSSGNGFKGTNSSGGTNNSTNSGSTNSNSSSSSGVTYNDAGSQNANTNNSTSDQGSSKGGNDSENNGDSKDARGIGGIMFEMPGGGTISVE